MKKKRFVENHINKICFLLPMFLAVNLFLASCSSDPTYVSYGEADTSAAQSLGVSSDMTTESTDIVTESKTTGVISETTTVSNENQTNKVPVKFSKKVDGDTAKFILPDNTKITCRFLAIDTPETVKPNSEIEPYGPEASLFTENALVSAKTIELEYDPDSDKTDKYGRTLAWVFVDGQLLQQQLVENGLAEVKYLYGDYLYTDMLNTAQASAKANCLGMWSMAEGG